MKRFSGEENKSKKIKNTNTEQYTEKNNIHTKIWKGVWKCGVDIKWNITVEQR